MAEACKHPDFEAACDINRIGEDDPDNPRLGFPRAYSIDIRVKCSACDEPFAGKGLPPGLSPKHPTGSIDGTEMRIPLRPLSAPADFGDHLPGFSVSVYVADDRADGEG